MHAPWSGTTRLIARGPRSDHEDVVPATQLTCLKSRIAQSALPCPMANATLPPLVNCPRTEPVPRNCAALTPAARVGLIAFGMLLAGLVTTACCLVPDPAGFGTHEQLGLEPCLTLRLWHTRCPSCGMTTAWSHAVRRQFASAARANVGGVVTCALALVVAPWALANGTCGRWIGWRPTEPVLLGVALTVVAVTLLDYLVRSGVIVWN